MPFIHLFSFWWLVVNLDILDHVVKVVVDLDFIAPACYDIVVVVVNDLVILDHAVVVVDLDFIAPACYDIVVVVVIDLVILDHAVVVVVDLDFVVVVDMFSV
jgi:hypothetical protein